MKANYLRQKYLNFFKNQGHAVLPSSPLVPENDPTTLFTGSGMQPLIEYFLGTPHPKGTRVVDSQKCFRSQDIEEVGDNRHTTFFEMLGNWSFGDYFKEEQLSWVFEFLTKEVNIDPKRLFVTVYIGNKKLGVQRDDESVQLWQGIFADVGIDAKAVDNAAQKGMQGGRIFYYGNDNWWSRSGDPDTMPVGEPGGPDSEIFYDFGEELDLHNNSEFKNNNCHVNCDCGRFLEIGNSVFMQYQKQKDGFFKELPKKNVDFGGGFERILAVSNNDSDVFKTDLFMPIIDKLEEISGQKYDSLAKDIPKNVGFDSKNHTEIKKSFRVIADHIRGAVMLAGDGVMPSNKEQGYYSRRLVRRAVRYGKMIGIEQEFIADLVPIVTTIYSQPYPQLKEKTASITKILQSEEQKFRKTLEKGLREFEKLLKINKNKSIGNSVVLNPADAFKMYETYGFPLELTLEIAQQQGVEILSIKKFSQTFKELQIEHSNKSRTASAGEFKGGLQDQSEITVKYHTATHLLHAALRKILGDHVGQKGSNLNGKRLRFDFSHTEALTPEQRQKVQDQINLWIDADLLVTQQTTQKQKALDEGALAFFVEKYPDEVSVYTIGADDQDWVSKELCGGPHVEKTGQIGKIEIFKEKSASAGIRRIYARLA